MSPDVSRVQVPRSTSRGGKGNVNHRRYPGESVSEISGNGFTLSRLVYGTNLRRTLVRALVMGLVLFAVLKFVFLPVRVAGLSMAPTYHSDQVNVVYRLAYMKGEPRRGDVVGVWPRKGGHRVLLMKRVVGLPGEMIGFRDGAVTVNGIPLSEPYVSYRSDWNVPAVLCGPDEYFVVGDNRSMDHHFHTMGRVERERIVGKMVL